MNSLVAQLQNSTSLDASDKRRILAQMQQLASDTDMEYLHAVYFPETSEPARIPCRFGMPSAIFTQNFNFYVNTGNTGSGFIGIAPQDTTHYCCFTSVDGIEADLGTDALQQNYSQFTWAGENGNYIPDKFSHARLVGCSIRITYIGQRDEESGFLCGSHIYTAGPLSVDEQLLEDGFFKHQVTPSQGLRMVFLPKDDDDLLYAPQEFRLIGSKTDTITPSDWFMIRDQGDDLQFGNGKLKLQVKQLNTGTGSNLQNYQWIDVNTDKIKPNAPSFYWGQHEQKGKSQYPNMMIAYFRGMKKNEDSLRVDVVRHFEGIPRQEIRDFCGVKRRGPSDRAVDFVKNKSMETKLHTHDLRDARQLETKVKPVMHKVVDKPEAVATLPSTNQHWYDGLMALVPDLAGAAGGLLGAEFGPVGMGVGGAIGHAFGTAAESYISPGNHAASSATFGGGVPYTGNVTANNNPVLALTF